MSTESTTRQGEDLHPDDANTPTRVSTARLWFGVAASAGAWFGLGLADMFITWRTCLHEEQFGGASAHPASRAIYFLFTFALFAVAATAGTMSYRDWRKLAGITALMQAEGQERSEFMALVGVFISFTLGMGIVWLCLPLFILQMCMRTR